MLSLDSAHRTESNVNHSFRNFLRCAKLRTAQLLRCFSDDFFLEEIFSPLAYCVNSTDSSVFINVSMSSKEVGGMPTD